MATQWFQTVNPVFTGTTPPTNRRFRAGTIKTDINGNRYVYLPGVASLLVGDFVTYNSVSASTAPARLVVNVVGPVAISMSANTSTTSFSWYMVYGNYATANVLDNGPAPGAALYASATAGAADDATSAGDWIQGATVTTQAVTAGGIGTAGVFISYPWTSNSAYLT